MEIKTNLPFFKNTSLEFKDKFIKLSVSINLSKKVFKNNTGKYFYDLLKSDEYIAKNIRFVLHITRDPKKRCTVRCIKEIPHSDLSNINSYQKELLRDSMYIANLIKIEYHKILIKNLKYETGNC